MTTPHVLLAGAGDLCQRTALVLLSEGYDVWGLRRHPPATDTSQIKWIAGDLTNPDSLRNLPSPITHVVYAPTPGTRDEAGYRAIFVQGLKNLMSALDVAALERFIFISSSAVYGTYLDQWVDESTPANPLSFNGQILLEAEQCLRDLPNAITFRLAGLYGPGRTPLLTRLRQGQVKVPRQGEHWVNRFHIEDAARATAHLLGLKRPDRCYIGADGNPHTMVELYDALAAMLKVSAPADDPRSGPKSSKRLSNARLRATGFTPMWPDAIDGYREIINLLQKTI